ncbi:MAG: hypothetical protein HC828_11750, partial [Blastochloris sp.]|nr:hypothetical protein [Blastochloris sp.]
MLDLYTGSQFYRFGAERPDNISLLHFYFDQRCAAVLNGGKLRQVFGLEVVVVACGTDGVDRVAQVHRRGARIDVGKEGIGFLGHCHDKLFATLDTRTRRWQLPHWGPVLLSDTVGFIRDLPHALVAAFQATLEETAEAGLLLHVIDSASPDRDQQISAVEKVLGEIGALEVPRSRS